MLRLLCVLSVLSTVMCATNLRVMEPGVYRGTPHFWHMERPASPTELLTVTIAVKQTNLPQLEATLLRVSDPSSPGYGRHLSMEQVHELVAPKAESVEVVQRWLSEHLDLSSKDVQTSPNSDFITLTLTVAEASELLHTSYALYRHTERSALEIIRCSAPYHVPADVAAHIDFVSPTHRFPVLHKTKIRSVDAGRYLDAVVKGQHAMGAPLPNDLFVTPTFLRALYQVGNATGQDPNNIQAVASFLEQYYSPNDLGEFFLLFQPTSIGHTVAQTIGPNDPSNPGTEANLDVQYLMSVGQGVTTWVYSAPGRAPTNPDNEPFLAWIVNVSQMATVPALFSVSYGEDEKSVGFDYASRINVEFQKIGVRGTSILVASGDSGAGGNCTASKNRFNPNFPTGSPWVTSVGGVTGGTAGAQPTGETADYISGGGFSDWWPRPSYQDAAIKAYISDPTSLPPVAQWNQSGRGYPDVAAQSEMFVIVQFGIPLPGVGGTSCATPTFSGVVGLLNDIRLRAGKSSLGFLNPLLYQIGAKTPNAFNDITVGANEGCDDITAFPARAGWDAVTGWGSPNYAQLSAVVASLP